jgi:lysophospholipase L1-like esterase
MNFATPAHRDRTTVRVAVFLSASWFIALLLFGALMQAQTEDSSTADTTMPSCQPCLESPKVVFMGDSITDYWRLEEFFPGKEYVNRGIAGQITPQMLARYQKDVLALHPDVVVILGGTNDIARKGGPPNPLSMTQDAVRAMTEQAQRQGIRVVLCSIPPVSNYSGTNRTNERPASAIQELNDWLRAYACEVHAAFADYFSVMADERGMLRADYADDGVHPNRKGYATMAPVIQTAIECVLQDPS